MQESFRDEVDLECIKDLQLRVSGVKTALQHIADRNPPRLSTCTFPCFSVDGVSQIPRSVTRNTVGARKLECDCPPTRSLNHPRPIFQLSGVQPGNGR